MISKLDYTTREDIRVSEAQKKINELEGNVMEYKRESVLLRLKLSLLQRVTTIALPGGPSKLKNETKPIHTFAGEQEDHPLGTPSESMESMDGDVT